MLSYSFPHVPGRMFVLAKIEHWASSVLKFVFMKHDEVLCQSVTWICLSESGQDLLRTADWTISALLTIADQDRYSDQNFPNYLCTLIQVHQLNSFSRSSQSKKYFYDLRTRYLVYGRRHFRKKGDFCWFLQPHAEVFFGFRVSRLHQSYGKCQIDRCYHQRGVREAIL